MATATRTRKTVDDYLHLPDDMRVELFEGEFFFMSPAPGFEHQNVIVNLTALLLAHVRDRRLGRVLCAPFDVVLSEENVVQPDVLFISNAHLGKIHECLYGAPDLAIEVLSPTHAERDRIVKRDLYRKYGVNEYWIADPTAKTIEVLVLEGSAWQLRAIYGVGDELASSVLKELRLAVREVFA